MRGRGWGVMCGCGGDSAVQSHSMGGVRKGEKGHTHTHTHTGTHTGTYTRMLHLPFGDLPPKKCPMNQDSSGPLAWKVSGDSFGRTACGGDPSYHYLSALICIDRFVPQAHVLRWGRRRPPESIARRAHLRLRKPARDNEQASKPWSHSWRETQEPTF